MVAQQDVRAFVLDKDKNIQTIDLTVSAEILGAGRHVVFSCRETISDYARGFLEVDRCLGLAPWNHRLYQPLRLPQIYEPNSFNLSGQSSGLLKPDFSCLMTCLHGEHRMLAGITPQDFYLINLEQWGEPEAVRRQHFSQTFEGLTGLTTVPDGPEILLVDNGRLLKVSWSGENWSTEFLPINTPAGQTDIKAYYWWFPNNRLWLLKDGSLWLATTRQEKLSFVDELGQGLRISDLALLPAGTFVFSDASPQPSLWYARVGSSKTQKIFGPVDTDPLFFCADRRGLIYVIETTARRLSLLLPPSHCRCLSCGFFCPDDTSGTICPYCRARLSCQNVTETPYTLWLDLDIAALGTRPGPMAVDEFLNLYILADQTRLTALTFSRRDLWGEQENSFYAFMSNLRRH